MSEWSLCYLKQNMSDCERNVRVSFKLSREAAIKLREIALAKSDLLCDLGVLAVQLGKESQICISSALTFENVNHSVSRAKKTRGKGSLVRSSVPKRKVTILERSVDKRRFSNVDRGVQRVDEALARAAVASVAVSDARPTLPSMGALNKATFMSKTSTHDAEDRSHEPRANSDHVTNAVNKPRNSCASFVENNTAERCVPMKSISSDGTIKFNAKDAENVNRGAVLGAVHANHPSKKKPFIVKQDCKNPKDDNVSVGKELPDDLGVSSSSDDNLKHATDMAACQESSRGKSSPQDNQVIQATVGDSKVSHNEKNIDVKYDKGDVAISSAASLENNGDDADTNMSSMSESFDCNDMPTFPRHGISFAQHLINLSKQYRLDNEKSPNGLANERFFEPSRFVRNDHVLRSFTTGNEKQEDFMGLSGQNALLFDGNYSATAVKTAEELSKEQSEASPTNLDSLSEASADSLFEEARLGSVDELRYGNENFVFRYRCHVCQIMH